MRNRFKHFCSHCSHSVPTRKSIVGTAKKPVLDIYICMCVPTVPTHIYIGVYIGKIQPIHIFPYIPIIAVKVGTVGTQLKTRVWDAKTMFPLAPNSGNNSGNSGNNYGEVIYA